jgi:hypothetical protein
VVIEKKCGDIKKEIGTGQEGQNAGKGDEDGFKDQAYDAFGFLFLNPELKNLPDPAKVPLLLGDDTDFKFAQVGQNLLAGKVSQHTGSIFPEYGNSFTDEFFL